MSLTSRQRRRAAIRAAIRSFIIRIILAVLFLASRLRFLVKLLPTKWQMRIPVGWTWTMFWTYMKPDGRVYPDIPCTMEVPESFAPRVEPVSDEHRMSEDEIRSFYEKGFTKPYTICSPEEMAEIRAQVHEAMFSPSKIYPPEFFEYVPPRQMGFMQDSHAASKGNGKSNEQSNEELARMAIGMRDRHLDHPVIMKLFAHPAVVERVAQLLGPDLLVWRSQYFLKAPNTLGTAFHQASHYLLDTLMFPSVQPVDMNRLFQLTVWISLTDAKIENGCMTIIPGTHKSIRPLRAEEFDPNRKGAQRFGAKDIRLDYPIETAPVESIEMKAGQFFIFTERVIHGSHPNSSSDQERRAINCRFITPDTQVYNDVLFKHGNCFRLLNLRNIRLDNWRAVLMRGEDKVHKNNDRIVPVARFLGSETPGESAPAEQPVTA